jgi:hypothetical protein
VVNVSKRLPEISHKVVHHIVTTGPPIAARFRRLDGEKLEAAKAVLTDHKPLTHTVSCVSDPWTARQCRHLAYVA